MAFSLEYLGYIGAIEYDDDGESFHGRIVNTKDVITFEGQSVIELKVALRESVEDYMAMCAEDGVEPEKPFSGKFVVRLGPELHREAMLAAAREDKSLNKFVREAVEERVQHVTG